jgi:hypothetical protein
LTVDDIPLDDLDDLRGREDEVRRLLRAILGSHAISVAWPLFPRPAVLRDAAAMALAAAREAEAALCAYQSATFFVRGREDAEKTAVIATAVEALGGAVRAIETEVGELTTAARRMGRRRIRAVDTDSLIANVVSVFVRYSSPYPRRHDGTQPIWTDRRSNFVAAVLDVAGVALAEGEVAAAIGRVVETQRRAEAVGLIGRVKD